MSTQMIMLNDYPYKRIDRPGNVLVFVRLTK